MYRKSMLKMEKEIINRKSKHSLKGNKSINRSPKCANKKKYLHEMMNLKHDVKTMASRSPFESTTTNKCGCELHLRGWQRIDLGTTKINLVNVCTGKSMLKMEKELINQKSKHNLKGNKKHKSKS